MKIEVGDVPLHVAVATLRVANGKQIKDLSDETGIAYSTIATFLQGRNGIAHDKLVRILAALGYQIALVPVEAAEP